MIEPAEIRQIVREEVTSLLAQQRSQLLAEIRELVKTFLLSEKTPVTPAEEPNTPPVASAPLPEELTSPEQEELAQIKELLEQKQALEAELEALSENDNIDALLNAFADQEAAVPPAVPSDPAYDPRHPWFLGIDLAPPDLHLCLADGITGCTYPLTLTHSPTQGQKVLADLCAHWAEYVHHPHLPPADLPTIFQHIQGVILSAPKVGFDLQALRLRHLVLQSGLQVKPEAILVLDRAIAPLLSVWHHHPESTDCHFYLHLQGQTTSFGFTSQPIVTAEVEQGADALELAIAQHLFPIIPTEATCLDLARQCHHYFQEHGDSSHWQYEQLSVSRTHYEQAQKQGLAPWLEQINRQLNHWLSQWEGMVIDQVWLMGIPSLCRAPLTLWLQAKFPHASLGDLPVTAIAEGLAVAPFHPSALDISRLEYSDYFLLSELCALRLPDVFDPKLLWQSLHQRGVNIRACGDRLQQIINQGLSPELELPLAPRTMLFQPTGDGRLSVCRDILVAVRSHLQQLQYELQQNLTEPLVFPYFRQLATP
jgi:hypothetical protein